MTATEQLKQAIALSGLSRREWYRQIYMLSDHWRELRGRAIQRDGGKCVRCHSTIGLQVHHLKYRSIFDVRLEDLETLCAPCHRLEHFTDRKIRKAKRKARTTRNPIVEESCHPAIALAMQQSRLMTCPTTHPTQAKNWYVNRARKLILSARQMTPEIDLLLKAMKTGKNGRAARAQLKSVKKI